MLFAGSYAALCMNGLWRMQPTRMHQTASGQRPGIKMAPR